MRSFRLQDWPPVAGEVFVSCRCEYCVGRFGAGHDEGLDAGRGRYAAVWRLDDAFARYRAARLAFLGEGHPEFKHIWLQLAREQYGRRRAAFAKVKAAHDD